MDSEDPFASWQEEAAAAAPAAAGAEMDATWGTADTADGFAAGVDAAEAPPASSSAADEEWAFDAASVCQTPPLAAAAAPPAEDAWGSPLPQDEAPAAAASAASIASWEDATGVAAAGASEAAGGAARHAEQQLPLPSSSPSLPLGAFDAAAAPPPAASSLASPPAASSLAPLPPLPAPSPPELERATLTTLSLSWAPVPGATSYFCEYEYRTNVPGEPAGLEWGGFGGRVVCGGSPVLPGPSCIVSGLHADAAYIVRVGALRTRRVLLPDGSLLCEQDVSSPASAPAGPFRTLAPDAEVARLQASNNALAAEALRLADCEADLADTSEQLTATAAEVSRLSGELEARVEELAASRQDAARCASEAVAAAAAAEAARVELAARLEAAAARGEALAAELSETRAALAAAREAADTAQRARLQLEKEAAARVESGLLLAREERDVLVNKLTGDLAKVMDELDSVTDTLHTAQDYIAHIEPAARLVMELRARQAQWDAAHKAIEENATGGGIGASGGFGLAKRAAMRKLGQRPELTL